MDYREYWEKGISYEDYLSNFSKEMRLGQEVLYAQYLPQNWTRQLRIHRKTRFAGSMVEKIKVQRWLVITEHWCGDASQIIPVFQKLADESEGKIEVRYVYRDQNPELIDTHLTDGRSRSIPIFLKLDNNDQVIKVYGPRPEEAQQLVKDSLLKGEDYNIPLHSWYAKDRQQSILYDLWEFVDDESLSWHSDND
ncbi:thioredoxin family protein [Portibacter marinus]|uniref:thioredoxin family protein n=1 Tax=Portibacter marinus TaxID=2898660 RepID=UPI001F33775F|nr:thioredoxin family protein [Portibacter marinus]